MLANNHQCSSLHKQKKNIIAKHQISQLFVFAYSFFFHICRLNIEITVPRVFINSYTKF